MNKMNFKIKALKTDRKHYTTGEGYFTKDKIYEFKSGYTMWDNGKRSDCYNNFEEFINANDDLKNEVEEYIDNIVEKYKLTCEQNEKLIKELSLYTEKVYIEDSQEGNQFLTVSSCPEGYKDQYGEEPFGNLIDIRMTDSETNNEMNMYLTNEEALKLIKELMKNINTL